MNEQQRLRNVTIADLRAIVDELDEFWDGREMAFLHQALYVHEFGETSVLAERDGRVLAYLLGFLSQDAIGYVHVLAVRRDERGRGHGRLLYARFEALARARGARALKAITDPGNARSIDFHRALGFSAREVPGYSASGEARIVFSRELGSAG